MNIDRQRIEAVKLLQHLGYRWSGVSWTDPPATDVAAEADALYDLCLARAE